MDSLASAGRRAGRLAATAANARALLLAILLAVAARPAPAQQPAEAPPPADPADVASIDAIIAALYDVISGPAGEERDWDRFRSLFVPGARLIPVAVPRGGGPARAVVGSVEDYIARSGPILVERGFFEREIARSTERFGHIAHAFSTYASYWKRDDAEPFARGINSIQLMYDGTRWWIVTVYWDSERPGQPIPAEYLRGH
ncbi:MAG TPA: hypothetical protein VF158_13485 [Longimicrobiales bacterium]